jgi:hypothetical protein
LIVFKKITVYNFRLAIFLSRFTIIKYLKVNFSEKKKFILYSLTKNSIFQIDNTKNKINDFSIYLNDKKNVVSKYFKLHSGRKVFIKISNLIKKKFSENLAFQIYVYERIIDNYISNYTALQYWSSKNSIKEKIYYLSFDIADIFLPKIYNIQKVILPINLNIIFNFLLKKININKINNLKSAKISLKDYNYKVGFLVHKSLQYANLYNKDYFYSKKKESSFHKSKIIHFFYSTNVLNKKLNNFFLLKSEKSLTLLFKYYFANIFYIRNVEDIFTLFFYIKFIIETKSYLDILKKYKSLKLFIIDNENQAPKSFLLALKKLNIKIISLEERSITKYNFPVTFMGDVYFTSSKFFFKKKFFKAKHFIPIGYPRTDEMIKYKSDGGFILVLGLLSDNNYSNQKSDLLINWESQIFFINQIINLCNIYKKEKFVLRFKTNDWINNIYFSEVKEKITKTENLIINTEPFSTYRLAQKSKLVISFYSTIVEEMLFVKKSVLIYDYNNTCNYIFKKSIRNGDVHFIFCNSFYELENKVRKILYNKKFRINLNNRLHKFMGYTSNIFNSKKILLKNLENLL